MGDGEFVVVFSHSKANELFYILKVIWKVIAPENIADANKHTVRKGESYVIGLYLQKLDEKKRSINYKLLDDKDVCFARSDFLSMCTSIYRMTSS